MDWPKVFSCSMVPLALGLYVVTVQCGSFVSDGPRDVLTICWGPEEHFLAWGELWESTNFMGLVELYPLCLFVREEIVSHSIHVHWLTGSTRALECSVMQDLMGQRHVGSNLG